MNSGNKHAQNKGPGDTKLGPELPFYSTALYYLGTCMNSGKAITVRLITITRSALFKINVKNGC